MEWLGSMNDFTYIYMGDELGWHNPLILTSYRHPSVGFPEPWCFPKKKKLQQPLLLSIESWLLNRDPYNGLLSSLYNCWVVCMQFFYEPSQNSRIHQLASTRQLSLLLPHLSQAFVFNRLASSTIWTNGFNNMCRHVFSGHLRHKCRRPSFLDRTCFVVPHLSTFGTYILQWWNLLWILLKEVGTCQDRQWQGILWANLHIEIEM